MRSEQHRTERQRIARHHVDDKTLVAARTEFAARIGGQVRSMSRAGRMGTCEWRILAGEFLDYLGALSALTPGLDRGRAGAEAKAVLRDGAEAAAGAVAFAAYFPYSRFDIMLSYVNFGMGYEPERGAVREALDDLAAFEWIDAFCLVVLADKAASHGEAFHFAREPFSGGDGAEDTGGVPSVELVRGLMAYVLGDIGDEEAPYPPGDQEKLAAIDAALGRIRARAEARGEALLERGDSLALRGLRALAAGDRDAFDRELTGLLLAHRETPGHHGRPRTLLPLVPLALAALAYRGPGWLPSVETDYLPRALVTGFADQGPRVGGLGRERRPDAVAALADGGRLAVARPENPRPVNPESEALFAKYTREALEPGDGKQPSARRIAWALRYQEMLFTGRAALADDVDDAQWATLRLASQMGAALFRIAEAEPGTEAEVTVEGRTVRCPASRGEDEAGPGIWRKAASYALISGVREDLAPLIRTGPAFVARDRGAFPSYNEALHAQLAGADPRPAMERALREVEKAEDWGVLAPPAVLLSQLVAGDEESFTLALADALEAHRAHYQVGDRADDPDAALNLDILALTCHARRQAGHLIRVDSPYLPPRLLAAATPR
ncbi:Imm49 family immunity protein [Streptomyces sp. NPDC093085]|uniref:immunity 49 family protein n=1 Tax=Streptomyces sp. NPDC093085 TaxID=3155068 RepID=UPI003434A910